MVFCAALRAAASPSSHTCHCARRSGPHRPAGRRIFSWPVETGWLASCGIFFAHLAGHAHLFQLHVQVEDFFQQIGGNARGILCDLCRVLFADLRAFQLEQVFGAAQGIFQRAIGVVEQRRVGQAPLPLVLAGAGKAVGMQLAAEAVKLVLQRGRSRLSRGSKPKTEK
jgi:hypothetical protein